MDDPIFATYAPRYAAWGLQVFPLAPGSKEPFKRSKGLKDATTDQKQIAEWARLYPNANIGIRTGAVSGVDVIDVDPKNGGFDTARALRDQGMPLPSRTVAKTRSDGYHLYVKHNPLIRTGTNRLGPGIDFRGDGGYVVAPGSVVDGKAYRMIRKAPFPEVPAWLLERIKAEEEAKSRPSPKKPVLLFNLGDDKERVLNALEYICCDDRDAWVKVGIALYSAFGSEGRQLWDAWSVQSDKYNERDQEKIWRSFTFAGAGLGTIFEMRRGQKYRCYEL